MIIFPYLLLQRISIKKWGFHLSFFSFFVVGGGGQRKRARKAVVADYYDSRVYGLPSSHFISDSFIPNQSSHFPKTTFPVWLHLNIKSGMQRTKKIMWAGKLSEAFWECVALAIREGCESQWGAGREVHDGSQACPEGWRRASDCC